MAKIGGKLHIVLVVVAIFTATFAVSALEPAVEKVLTFGQHDVNHISIDSQAHEYHFVTSMQCPTSVTIMVEEGEAEGSPFVTITEDRTDITTAAFVAPALGATHWLPPGGNGYTIWMEQNNPSDAITYTIEISEDCNRQFASRNAVDALMSRPGNNQIGVARNTPNSDDVANITDPTLGDDSDEVADDPSTISDDFMCIGVFNSVTTRLLSLPSLSSGISVNVTDELAAYVRLTTEDGLWAFVLLGQEVPVSAWVDTSEIGLFGDCDSLPVVDINDVIDGRLDGVLDTILHDFIDEVVEVTEAVTNDAGEIVGEVTDAATGIAEDITDTATEIVDDVTDTTTEIVEDVTDTATEIVDDVTDTTTEIVDDVTDTVTEIVDDVTDATTEVVEDVTEQAPDVVEDVVEDVTEIIDDIADQAGGDSDGGIVGGLLGGG